ARVVWNDLDYELAPGLAGGPGERLRPCPAPDLLAGRVLLHRLVPLRPSPTCPRRRRQTEMAVAQFAEVGSAHRSHAEYKDGLYLIPMRGDLGRSLVGFELDEDGGRAVDGHRRT